MMSSLKTPLLWTLIASAILCLAVGVVRSQGTGQGNYTPSSGASVTNATCQDTPQGNICDFCTIMSWRDTTGGFSCYATKCSGEAPPDIKTCAATDAGNCSEDPNNRTIVNCTGCLYVNCGPVGPATNFTCTACACSKAGIRWPFSMSFPSCS